MSSDEIRQRIEAARKATEAMAESCEDNREQLPMCAVADRLMGRLYEIKDVTKDCGLGPGSSAYRITYKGITESPVSKGQTSE